MIEEGFKRFDGVTILKVFKDSITFKLDNGLVRFAELRADYINSYRYKAASWTTPMNFVPDKDKIDEFKEQVLEYLTEVLTGGTKVNVVVAVVKKNVNVEIVTRIEFY